MIFLIQIIKACTTVLSILLLAYILVHFILDPYHHIRQQLDSIVDPMLAPIRRVIPQLGMFDFSPLILLIIVDIVAQVLIQILVALS